MDVVVTGGTGVLGRATVPLLVAAGHRVRGLSRSEGNDEVLRRLGAVPVRAELFEPSAVRAAVGGNEAVLHLATRIPSMAKAGRLSAWAENDRIRTDGTRHLVDAALATGVKTFVYPSVVFVYPDGGDRWLDAATIAPAAPPADHLRSTLAAEAEVGRMSAAGGRGVVLRMGAFYGPTSGHSRGMLRLARWGIGTAFGPADGYLSSVWIGDAATAVVAALARAPAGVYDVVDDEPTRRGDWNAALARAVGRRRLIGLPPGVVRVLGGKVVVALSTSQRVSNRRFREVTDWAPAVPNARIGLSRLAAEVAHGAETGTGSGG